ncbi:cell filamentation protein Fic [Thiocapsa imhoffii]|uniref:Cell filamentation protein Fic n=1 Tax=Thiocapsa imhoffii TaxID=382777 RepID=A0A9X0WLC2_9GAMM|nr:Fic family protein [Thiocapsa imhoffii]MBK1646829.1 cell filamentation protein Fic [Thiocapsa imhoffii]
MVWNWQQSDWPDFAYDSARLAAMESRLLHESGLLFGAFAHLDDAEQRALTVDLIGDEALMTARIEGEFLDRDSLQSSLLREFGLAEDPRRVAPAEAGMAELMVDLYRHFQIPLTHEMLWVWHRMLMAGRRDLRDVGRYRTLEEPMQVVSGAVYAPRVHFEAPPARRVPGEMDHFVAWLQLSAPTGEHPLPTLTRAGIAHLYFVTIHPFEDGNGRIARAIAEKVLAQGLGQPTLIALSHTIERHKKAYYSALERANKVNRIDDWLDYFADTVLHALDYTRARVVFLIGKAKLYDRLRGRLNARQEKVLARLFRAGPEGFVGGLSAENYIAIARTSRATATRDLQDLVAKGALVRTGERKHTRYTLNLAKAATQVLIDGKGMA